MAVTEKTLWHTLSSAQTLKKLETTKQGLGTKEVTARQTKYGLNSFSQQHTISKWQIFVDQFKGFLILLLFVAALLALIIREWFDAIAILVILLINAVVGFIEEYKAEQAIEELREMETPHALVIRNKSQQQIDSTQLVPGDILLLSEGDQIPADARILESYQLQTDESVLTGESNPSNKDPKKLASQIALAERVNLVFAGTVVTRGKGKAVVYATGDNTEFGKIAHLVQTATATQTPLQITLEKLGKTLGIISLVIATPGLIIGINSGRSIVEMIMLSISLAVSAIPEGLPVVVTVTLALGAQRLLKRRVLVRKLSAVESLGNVDIICTDKTGTITQNKMSATQLVTRTHLLETDQFSVQLRQRNQTIRSLVNCALLCNDATLESGDPTETALLKLCQQFKLEVADRELFPRLDEIPFNSQQKYMVTLNQVENRTHAFLKGAPEQVLAMCSQVSVNTQVRTLTDADRTYFEDQIESLTAQGMRVLALAMKKNLSSHQLTKPSKYIFLGLVGFIDPARSEVTSALTQCHQAGIRVLMLTGDHPLTAKAVAHQIGLVSDRVVVGSELNKLGRHDLEELVSTQNIFARVTPEHKLTILRALHNLGHNVAMTGDGANDAPALKEADIGVAVGNATDLAKEVSDMVLIDNNFAHIVDAVEEARGIFANIKKFITFLLAANFDEIFVVLAALLLGTPLPLLPIHLLWLNVVTDSFPALALAVDKYPAKLMHQKPFNPSKEITHGVIKFSLAAGIIGFVATMFIFLREYFFLRNGLSLSQTMTFTTTVFFELWLVFSVRSNKGAFQLGLLSNKFLNIAVLIAISLQLAVMYHPVGNELLKIVPVPLGNWPDILLFSFSGFGLIELTRWIKRKIS